MAIPSKTRSFLKPGRHLCACPTCGTLARVKSAHVGQLTDCRVCRSRFYAMKYRPHRPVPLQDTRERFTHK